MCCSITVAGEKASISQETESIKKNFKFSKSLIDKSQPLKAFNLYIRIAASLKKISSSDKTQDFIFAYEYSQMLINNTDSFSMKYKDAGSRLIISKFIFPVIENTIGLAYKLYTITNKDCYFEQAFTLAEKNKNLLTIQSLRDSKVKEFSGIPMNVLEDEKNISSKLVILRNQLESEYLKLGKQGDSKVKQLEKEILQLQQKNDSLNYFIEKNFPKYYQLRFKNKFASVDQVREELLQNDRSLIEFFYGDSSIYLFSISKAHKTFVQIAHQEEVYEAIKLLQVSILKSNFNEFVSSSYLLYKVLLLPLKLSIKSKIIIIPDGPINFIPFECLISADDDKTSHNYKTLPYLINKFQFTYGSSVTTLLESKNKKQISSPPKLIAFAPVFSEKQKAVIRSIKNHKTDSMYLNLSEQRWSSKLLKNLKHLIDGSYMTYENANVSTFNKLEKKYDIIHIASHTLINHTNPMESKIVFSKEIKGDSVYNEGYLYAYDLYGMNINASMVVLGSCQTGMGDFKKCDGIMSIAHGFSYAGCPSIVYTLWEVDEKESNTLMEYFYKELTKGIPKDEALHNAKKTYLSQANEITANPYYWAGFIFSGNNSAFDFQNKNEYLFYLIPGLLLFFVLVFFIIVLPRYKNQSNS